MTFKTKLTVSVIVGFSFTGVTVLAVFLWPAFAAFATSFMIASGIHTVFTFGIGALAATFGSIIGILAGIVTAVTMNAYDLFFGDRKKRNLLIGKEDSELKDDKLPVSTETDLKSVSLQPATFLPPEVPAGTQPGVVDLVEEQHGFTQSSIDTPATVQSSVVGNSQPPAVAETLAGNSSLSQQVSGIPAIAMDDPLSQQPGGSLSGNPASQIDGLVIVGAEPAAVITYPHSFSFFNPVTDSQHSEIPSSDDSTKGTKEGAAIAKGFVDVIPELSPEDVDAASAPDSQLSALAEQNNLLYQFRMNQEKPSRISAIKDALCPILAKQKQVLQDFTISDHMQSIKHGFFNISLLQKELAINPTLQTDTHEKRDAITLVAQLKENRELLFGILFDITPRALDTSGSEHGSRSTSTGTFGDGSSYSTSSSCNSTSTLSSVVSSATTILHDTGSDDDFEDEDDDPFGYVSVISPESDNDNDGYPTSEEEPGSDLSGLEEKSDGTTFIAKESGDAALAFVDQVDARKVFM